MAGAITGTIEEGKRAGDIEHAEILGRGAFAVQHIYHEREVGGRVHAEAEGQVGPADQAMRRLAALTQ
jgi:hypothetical protein